MAAPTTEDIAGAVSRLLQSVRTLQLATLNEAGAPLASYAPFVHEPGQGFYIFVSELARHTGNMRARAETGALIIADEAVSRQTFARERLSFACQAEFIARNHSDWAPCLDSFETRFGPVLKVLKGLGDFHLVALRPRQGVYIRGFGEAWSFEGPGLDYFSHVDSEALKRASAKGSG